MQSWHLTVQRELAQNLVLDVAYVGNRSNGLMILGDYNQARPNAPGENLPLIQRRPIPGFDYIQISWGGGFANYHALQAKVEKRYSAGIYLLNSFTWSKTIDNASGHLEAFNGDNSRVNFRNIPAEKGLGAYDQPFNNTTSVVWELPYGKGRRWGGSAPGIVDGILGGWRLTGINTMTSGQPINITYSPATIGQVSGAPSYRPNYVGGDLYSADKNPTNYFNRLPSRFPTARSRSATWAGTLREPSRSTTSTSACTRSFALWWRIGPPAVPLRVLQPVQHDEPRGAGAERQQRELRRHHVAVESGAADSVRAEAGLLIGRKDVR